MLPALQTAVDNIGISLSSSLGLPQLLTHFRADVVNNARSLLELGDVVLGVMQGITKIVNTVDLTFLFPPHIRPAGATSH